MGEQETFREAVTRLRRAPAAEQLDRLRDAVAPGGRIARVRRLPGGLQCGMHALDLVTTEGERLRLVIRRYTPQQAAGDSGVCRREWDTLRLLAEVDAPAPRPVFLDDEGTIFGTPTLVMTRLPGRAFVSFPSEMEPWLAQFAGALAATHRTDVSAEAAAHLSPFTGVRTAATLDPGAEANRRVAALSHGAEILSALRERWPPAPPTRPVLLHADYYTGNTVWNRHRLSGVVDWGNALLGPPELDVSSARLDLALLAGPEAAGRFLGCYERISGYRTEQMPLWDLTRVWGGALLLDLWCEALHDVGTAITREQLGSRFEAFALGALERLA